MGFLKETLGPVFEEYLPTRPERRAAAIAAQQAGQQPAAQPAPQPGGQPPMTQPYGQIVGQPMGQMFGHPAMPSFGAMRGTDWRRNFLGQLGGML